MTIPVQDREDISRSGVANVVGDIADSQYRVIAGERPPSRNRALTHMSGCACVNGPRDGLPSHMPQSRASPSVACPASNPRSMCQERPSLD